MKRLTSVFLTGAFILAACPAINGAAPVEINFWHGITAADGDYLSAMTKKFQKENPNIKIKYQGMDWNALYDKILVSMAAGKAPEVFIVHVTEFDWFQQAKALRPLDAYINGPTGISKTDRVASAWKIVEVSGKIWGVPLDNHNEGLVYNTDHFKEAGLNPNDPPSNYEEFIQAGQKLRRVGPNGKTTRLGLVHDLPGWDFQGLLAQFGGRLFTPDKSKAIMNSDAGIKAVQILSDFRNKYRFADFGSMDQLTSGRASMIWTGPWWWGSLQKAKNLNWKAAEFPQFGTEKATYTGGHIMFIPPTATGKKLEAAVKFVKWMSDHSVDWAKAGQIPVRKSALESADFKALPLQSVYARMLPYAYFEPHVRRPGDVYGAYFSGVDKVWKGQGDPKQALDQSAANATRILSALYKRK